MELSLVMPAYNEEKIIVSSLHKVYDYLCSNGFDFEIIIVNDGSGDNTKSLVEGFIESRPECRFITYEPRQGKGNAVRTGMLAAQKEFVMFTDADLSTPIEELGKFVKYVPEYDIVIGSRKMKGSNIVIKQPIYRRLPGKVFPFLVQVMGISQIKDTQCGFKLFKREASNILFNKQKLTWFSFDAEIIYLAEKKYKYRIKELPVRWENNLDSKLETFKDSYKMFKELVNIKVNDMKGGYK